jgi:hypothetical protein
MRQVMLAAAVAGTTLVGGFSGAAAHRSAILDHGGIRTRRGPLVRPSANGGRHP